MDLLDPDALPLKPDDFTWEMLLSSINESLLSRHKWLLSSSSSTEIAIRFIRGKSMLK